MGIDSDRLPDDACITCIFRLPECLAQHSDAWTAAIVVGLRDQPPDLGANTECGEVLTADPSSGDAMRLAAGRKVEAGVAERERGAEHVLPIANRFPEWIREDVVVGVANDLDQL